MLSASSPIVFIATAAPDRARTFDAETLGLTLINEDDFSIVFALGGIPLRIQKVRELQPHPLTGMRRVARASPGSRIPMGTCCR